MTRAHFYLGLAATLGFLVVAGLAADRLARFEVIAAARLVCQGAECPPGDPAAR